MGYMKPLIVQQVGQQIRDCADDSQALELVESYYADIVWSAEKDEWDDMSEEAHLMFVQMVRT